MFVSKFLVTIFYTNLILILSLLVTYMYSGVIFGQYMADISLVSSGFIGIMMFVNFNIALAYFIISFTKNNFLVMVVTLFNYYALPSLISIFSFIKITPYTLVSGITMSPASLHYKYSLLLTLSVIIVMIGLGMYSIQKYKLE